MNLFLQAVIKDVNDDAEDQLSQFIAGGFIENQATQASSNVLLTSLDASDEYNEDESRESMFDMGENFF